ncbi:hypothetical protein WJX73_001116 [Symbiochloris irregularis]|uniref:Uncharacterized protein n=1 Tax=Symbiochloris irregularis TaxID=706552 RepID=A0AAW1NXI0_9CHLO
MWDQWQGPDGSACPMREEWPAERGLLALSNSWAYGEDESFVFAETSKRVASMVQSLMPYAVLAPHATLQQLVATGASSAGQGKLMAEVLAAMPALASLQPWNAMGSSAPSEAVASAQLTTVLLDLLLEKLLSLEDSVAQADAFLSFSITLCTPSATYSSTANSPDREIGLTALSTALQIAARCIEQIAEATPHLQLEEEGNWLVQHVKEVGRQSGRFSRPVRTVLQPCYLAFIQQPASLQNRAELYIRGLKDAPDYKEFVKRVLLFAAVNDASADHLARVLASSPSDAVSRFAETQSWLAQYDSMLIRCAKGLPAILVAPAAAVGPALIAERAWVDVVHACAQILTTSSRLRCDRLVSKVLGPLLARVHPYMRTMKTATPLDQQALLTWTLSQVVYLVGAGAVPLPAPEESSGPSAWRRDI